VEITISSLYLEPGYKFDISHKVDLSVRQKLEELLISSYGLDKIKEKYFLSLIISTDSKSKTVLVRGPSIDKRNEFITWSLNLPYLNVNSGVDYVPKYLEYLFDALVLVFKNYGVNEEDIRKVQQIVEKEVINNPNYEFNEEVIEPPDLSDLNLGGNK
jgi:hypothetical protein